MERRKMESREEEEEEKTRWRKNSELNKRTHGFLREVGFGYKVTSDGPYIHQGKSGHPCLSLKLECRRN